MLAGTLSAVSPDSMAIELRGVEAVGDAGASVRAVGPGRLRVSTSGLQRQMRRFGEADVVERLKQEPGIGSMGDFGSGLAVDGAEPSQTVYRLANVPVFFPYRFGGIFSVFNSAHFAAADFERGIHSSSMPSRLGARLDFRPYERVDDLAATVNVGILGSGLTLRAKAFDRVSAVVSGRVSYIDELYGPLLEGNESNIRYRFSDFNVTLGYRVDSINALSVNGFVSGDRLGYDDRHYAMDMVMHWRNLVFSAEWSRRGRTAAMKHRAFYTGFTNRLSADMPQLSVALPAAIGAVGLSGEIDFGRVHCGYELQFYEASEPEVDMSGYGDLNSGPGGRHAARFRPFETRIYCDYDIPLTGAFTLTAGLSAGYYMNGRYRTVAPDPRVTLTHRRGGQTISLHAGVYHQYLHQAGFSEVGLASDFWICATRKTPAQSAAGFTVEYAREVMAGLTFSASAYWRRMRRQAEYDGILLDLVDQDYDVGSHILQASGHNWGADMALRFSAASFSGLASVGYGGTLRHFPDCRDALPARTDPGWSVKVNAEWNIDRNWSVGGNFAFNTGRRYTPTRSIYLIADNLICDYGPRNSATMPAYHRLDLSASYILSRGRFRHIFNCSLINAYGHRNVEMQTFVINTDNGAYRLRRIYSMYRFLPSLSYTLKF